MEESAQTNNNDSIYSLVLLGKPGSGKGTQSQMLIDKYGFNQISTGDAIREICNSNLPEHAELKKSIKDAAASGELVSDNILKTILLDKIVALGQKQKRLSEKETELKIIFDGYPRTREQVLTLNEIAGKPNVVLNFDISDEVAEIRMLSRAMNCLEEEMKRIKNIKGCFDKYNLLNEVYSFNKQEHYKNATDDEKQQYKSNVKQVSSYFKEQVSQKIITGDKVAREDDLVMEARQTRLQEYKRNTDAIISCFNENGIFVNNIDATKAEEQVAGDVQNILENSGIIKKISNEFDSVCTSKMQKQSIK